MIDVFVVFVVVTRTTILLKNIIQEMTIHEKECIKKCIYHDLWNKLWIKTNEKCEKKNIDKFNFIKYY